MKDFFDEISTGMELPPLLKDISKKRLVMYSAATWDFHPGHYDPEFAKRHGSRDVFMDGPMAAAFMAQLVTDWAGLAGTLQELSMKNRSMVFLGDQLTCTGKVARIDRPSRLAECDLLLTNQEGKIVADGKATVAFPGLQSR